MTPEKRAYLWKIALALIATGLLVGGYITQQAWLPVVMGT